MTTRRFACSCLLPSQRGRRRTRSSSPATSRSTTRSTGGSIPSITSGCGHAWSLPRRPRLPGSLPPAAFEALRGRFNAMHEWAVEHFGETQLVAAARAFRSGDYEPPVADDEGPPAPVPHVRKSAADTISPEAIALVDAISDQALSFGWKRERLYGVGSSGIFDPRRGLVCFSEARRPHWRSHTSIHRDHWPTAKCGTATLLQSRRGSALDSPRRELPGLKTNVRACSF